MHIKFGPVQVHPFRLVNATDLKLIQRIHTQFASSKSSPIIKVKLVMMLYPMSFIYTSQDVTMTLRQKSKLLHVELVYPDPHYPKN
jgi:hypothetical protein